MLVLLHRFVNPPAVRRTCGKTFWCYRGLVPDELGIAAAAVLADESRRGMFAFIRRANRPVTRDEAAAAIGISRKLAAFHLEKLVAAGVLDVSTGSAGALRGVGRAPKLYVPSALAIRVSIPPSDHQLLARMLLDAVGSARPGESTTAAALRTAREHGRRLGVEERARSRPGRLGPERALTLAGELLARHGYEPERPAPARVQLRNCPFHPLAATSPELVCGMNQALCAGMLTGLQAPNQVQALLLRPGRGECCVQLQAANQTS